LFLTLKSLIGHGYDVILDVSLVDPIVESVLIDMLRSVGYETRMSLMAVGREVSDEFIKKRQSRSGRRVAEASADEFWRVTSKAIECYAQNCPDMKLLVWNFWSKSPVFDGRVGDKELRGVLEKSWKVKERLVEAGEEDLRAAKKTYTKKWA
jgi:hypothetical protein